MQINVWNCSESSPSYRVRLRTHTRGFKVHQLIVLSNDTKLNTLVEDSGSLGGAAATHRPHYRRQCLRQLLWRPKNVTDLQSIVAADQLLLVCLHSSRAVLEYSTGLPTRASVGFSCFGPALR